MFPLIWTLKKLCNRYVCRKSQLVICSSVAQSPIFKIHIQFNAIKLSFSIPQQIELFSSEKSDRLCSLLPYSISRFHFHMRVLKKKNLFSNEDYIFMSTNPSQILLQKFYSYCDFLIKYISLMV